MRCETVATIIKHGAQVEVLRAVATAECPQLYLRGLRRIADVRPPGTADHGPAAPGRGRGRMIRMQFYISKDSAGNIHVQNAVMGYLGQHHVHTPKDFAAWKKSAKVAAKDCHQLKVACDCGLKSGQVTP